MPRATYHCPAALHPGVVPAAPRVEGGGLSDAWSAGERGEPSDGCRYPCRGCRDLIQARTITAQLIDTYAPNSRRILLRGLG
jgi:hypothetical protein